MEAPGERDFDLPTAAPWVPSPVPGAQRLFYLLSLCVLTPQTIACQAPLSRGFSRQEYWNRLPFPSPRDLPNPGIEPGSPTFQADALTSGPPVIGIKWIWKNLGNSWNMRNAPFLNGTCSLISLGPVTALQQISSFIKLWYCVWVN